MDTLLENGVDLSNINDRLQNLYHNNYFFKIGNIIEGEGGVETIISIPLH